MRKVDYSGCHCEKLGFMCAKCWKAYRDSGYRPDRRPDYPAFPVADRAGKYRSDGYGCVERVHPTELAIEERYG